ncbi:MAG: redoxin domain-containing protein [Prevotella sp.]|nr:redoxin domain-containing protein [Prevotella sp.]
MKRIYLLLTAMILTLPLTVFAQQTNRLSLSADPLVAGQTINVSYDAKGGPLGGEAHIYGFAYTYDDYKWHIRDVILNNSGDNIWKGSFTIPEDCGLVAFKFQSTLSQYPDTIDNNDNQGYIYMVGDADKKPMPGAQLAWGLLRKPSLNMGIQGYFSQGYQEISDEAIMMWLDKETKMYPTEGHKFFNVMKSVFRHQYGDKAEGGIRYLLSVLEAQPNKTEEDVYNIWSTYLFDLKEQGKADSVIAAYEKIKPYSMLNRRVKAQALAKLDKEHFYQAADEFRKNYPFREWVKNPDPQGFPYANFYSALERGLYADKQYDKMMEVMEEGTFATAADVYMHGPLWLIQKAPTDPKEYVEISKRIIDCMEAKVDENIDYYGRSQTDLQMKEAHQNTLNYYLCVQAEIFQRSERYQDAVDFMNKIIESERFKLYPAGNQAYILSLEKLGRNEESIQALKSAAAAAQMTPLLIDKLHAYYDGLKEKPAKTFDEYMSSLKSSEAKEMMLKHVREGLVNEPFTPFDLQKHNAKGTVNSNSFGKDDIVVLDFWATWCAPCIAALAGMQLAVDKYANDPHVKFYFVQTQDTPGGSVDRIWARGKYHNMQVIYDQNKSAESKGYNKVYSDMFKGTSGIPQKAILKNGRIRYRAEGYGGSPSGLMDEITAVIEILKNEK